MIELYVEIGLQDPFCHSIPDFVEGWLRPREGKLLPQGPTAPRREPGHRNSLCKGVLRGTAPDSLRMLALCALPRFPWNKGWYFR